MKASGYDAAEIAEAVASQKQELTVAPPPPDNPITLETPDYNTPWAPSDDDTNDPLVASLTEEDKLMLLMKWGKSYRPAEWV